MNDLIAWLATNNALMIRIGFSAVAILVVAYVFRLFFMPRDVEKHLSDTEAVASSTTASMNIEELAELQTEIDTLKEKLKTVETEKISLQKQLHEQPVNIETATAATAEGVKQVTPVVDVAAAKESADKINIEQAQLIEKIQQLEARLAEYEIIAEDIAEVGQLKNENAQLKEQLEKAAQKASEPQVVAPSETIEKPTVSEVSVVEPAGVIDSSMVDEVLAAAAQEITAHVDTSASDAEIDALLQESLGSTSESVVSEPEVKAAAQTHVVLQSELEVTEEEQKIIDDFESFQNRKKG